MAHTPPSSTAASLSAATVLAADRAVSDTPGESSIDSQPQVAQAANIPHIPRPPNAFIIFRQRIAATARIKGETHQQAVSKAAGDLWRVHKAANDAVYRSFVQQQHAARRLHRERYADYEYRPVPPRRRKQVRAGDQAQAAARKAAVLAAVSQAASDATTSPSSPL